MWGCCVTFGGSAVSSTQSDTPTATSPTFFSPQQAPSSKQGEADAKRHPPASEISATRGRKGLLTPAAVEGASATGDEKEESDDEGDNSDGDDDDWRGTGKTKEMTRRWLKGFTAADILRDKTLLRQQLEVTA